MFTAPLLLLSLAITQPMQSGFAMDLMGCYEMVNTDGISIQYESQESFIGIGCFRESHQPFYDEHLNPLNRVLVVAAQAVPGGGIENLFSMPLTDETKISIDATSIVSEFEGILRLGAWHGHAFAAMYYSLRARPFVGNLLEVQYDARYTFGEYPVLQSKVVYLKKIPECKRRNSYRPCSR